MLRYLEVEGSPYELGVTLGQFGKDAVRALLLPSSAWASVMAWKGDPAVDVMRELTQERFPAIWQELEGLAHGLDLPLDEVFLWNCRGDLWAMAPDGCTTVLLPGADGQDARLSHNEDGLPFFKNHCAVVRAGVRGQADVVSFAYPGSIPGHTFAVNARGLGITVNNVRTRLVPAGVPRMVLGRAALNLDSASAVQRLLEETPRAGGFHFSIAQAGLRTLTSIEFTAHRVSVVQVSAAAVHANHLVHPAMRHHPQVVTNSSGFRQERGEAMLAAAAKAGTAVDPLAILADQQHSGFTILRNAADDSDDENTMATADMQVGANAIEWTVLEDGQRAPVMRFHNAAPVGASSA